MELSLKECDTSLFQLNEFKNWNHPVFYIGGGNFRIKYSGRWIETIKIPSNGLYRSFESTTHEVGHIVLNILNNKMERNFYINYSLSFEKVLKNPKKALYNELDVLLIQFEIFKKLNIDWNDVRGKDGFTTSFEDSVRNLSAFNGLNSDDPVAEWIEDYLDENKNKFSFQDVKDAWFKFLNEVNSRCIKSKRLI